MTGYRYPDEFDRTPARWARRTVPPRIGWDELDERLVRHAASLLGSGATIRAVDVGAGEGRLLAAISAVAGEVVVVEPDRRRIRAAQEQATTLGLANCSFACADLDGFTTAAAGSAFDLVICSHVIQHLAIAARPEFCAALTGLLALNGILVLTFPASLEPGERFVVSSKLPDGATGNRIVDAVEFDRTVRSCAQVEGGARDAGLPAWHSASGQVESLLADAGLIIVEQATYREFEFDIIGDDGHSTIGLPASDVAVLARSHPYGPDDAHDVLCDHGKSVPPA